MFRDEARRLKDWYESSSKSEKYAVSAFLVDFVRKNGGRFLVRSDGNGKGEWEEVDPDDARRKSGRRSTRTTRGGRRARRLGRGGRRDGRGDLPALDGAGCEYSEYVSIRNDGTLH